MLKNFFKGPIDSIRKILVKPQAKEFQPISQRKDLVKSRPMTLAESYTRTLDKPELDALFMRMRRNLWRELDGIEKVRGKALASKESGRTATGQPYFYVKPFNHQGWLFERSDAGWVICFAEKIHTTDTFIRSEYAWDVATCLTNQNYEATPRINSTKFDLKLVSLSLYEEMAIGTVLKEII